MFRIEDLNNVSMAEKNDLITLFDELGLPHVVSETHYIISADMQHDNAFVRKGLDDNILPYIKEVAPTASFVHVRSDGCKARQSSLRSSSSHSNR